MAQDLDDPAHYSPFLLQGGLAMPDRDYYLNPSPKMAEIRGQYQAHIAAVLRLAQVDDAKEKATAIYELERRIAEVHSSREASEDVLKGNNHWPSAEFPRRAPGLDWPAFFAGAQLAHQDVFVVWQPSAVTGISALTASVPLATWKDWLRFHLIEQHSPYLARAFVEEHFAFHQHVLSGTPQQQVRWKLAVAETNTALGEAVGQLYVEALLPGEREGARRGDGAPARAGLRRSHRPSRVDGAADPRPGQGQARRPEGRRWLSGSLAQLRRPGSGSGRCLRQRRARRSCSSTGGTSPSSAKPVDRSEWVMTPQLVNAVNLPAMNALNFPAAILQPPYFDPTRDPVMDYGATGAVIGHEISHSFDNQGALFDATGRLRNWWTEEDFEHFEAAGKRLAEQFDQYHPFPDVAVNGRQTLSGEHRGRGRAVGRLRRLAQHARGQARRRASMASPASSCSSSASRRAGRQRSARRRCAAASSPTATRRPSTAPTRCAISTPGTTPSSVQPAAEAVPRARGPRARVVSRAPQARATSLA